jgi:hypothetical protein
VLHQVVAQDDGAVVECVVRAVEQRDGAAPAGVDERLPGFGMGFQLLPIAAPEFIPAFHPMIEPFPELRAGRYILEPSVDGEGLFLHASRPEPLDQNTPAIAARSRLVRALDADHDGSAVSRAAT